MPRSKRFETISEILFKTISATRIFVTNKRVGNFYLSRYIYSPRLLTLLLNVLCIIIVRVNINHYGIFGLDFIFKTNVYIYLYLRIQSHG